MKKVEDENIGQAYKWTSIENIVVVAIIFVWIILCVGTPDLLDAIIKRVSSCR